MAREEAAPHLAIPSSKAAKWLRVPPKWQSSLRGSRRGTVHKNSPFFSRWQPSGRTINPCDPANLLAERQIGPYALFPSPGAYNIAFDGDTVASPAGHPWARR
jgi:hypothetical protein